MSKDNQGWLQGRCLCSSVVFYVKDAFLYAGYCHCSECRKFSGAACSPNAGIEAEFLRIEQGEAFIKEYVKTPASTMCFCGNCGSSLFVKKPQWGRVHVRLGSLIDEPSMHPSSHYHVASKARWEVINDELPRYEAAPKRD